MDYESDMYIDDSALDIEWLEQAPLAMKYVKYYARCKKIEMLAEEKIKVVRAELVKLANDNPDKYLGKDVKPTGPNVEAFYRNHPRHKKAKEEWIEAVFNSNIADGAKWQIGTTRKESLENLVKLISISYFAGPSVPRNLSEERREQKQTDNLIMERISKRNKNK